MSHTIFIKFGPQISRLHRCVLCKFHPYALVVQLLLSGHLLREGRFLVSIRKRQVAATLVEQVVPMVVVVLILVEARSQHQMLATISALAFQDQEAAPHGVVQARFEKLRHFLLAEPC